MDYVLISSSIKNYLIINSNEAFKVADVLMLRNGKEEVIRQIRYVARYEEGIKNNYYVLALGELTEEQLEEIKNE